jgi:GST-like protein
MIELYYWPTPNGWKISIALEELELPYQTRYVNIGRGGQFSEDFLRISPNNRIPAIVDHDAEGGPLSIFESGAILSYLAEKTGRLMPTMPRGRYEVLQWLFWQVGGLGPMTGQCNHFRNYAPAPNDYGVARYTDEVNRLYGVMNRRLADREFLAGDYSIADIAAWPWVVPWKKQGQNLDDFSNLRRWFDAIRARPAVQRGFELGQELRRHGPPDEKARSVLFGQRARP